MGDVYDFMRSPLCELTKKEILDGLWGFRLSQSSPRGCFFLARMTRITRFFCFGNENRSSSILIARNPPGGGEQYFFLAPR
jgi:hypothetical protein